MLPPILVIFGISGDLSRRKLLPALYRLLNNDILPPETKIIGISRKDLDIDELLGSVELCVLEKDNICDPAGLQKLRAAIESFQLSPDSDADFVRLSERLDSLEDGQESEKRERLFYMSIPPDAYGPIIGQMGKHNLNNAKTRLLLEKPFGYDLQSAKDLISLITEHFDESQIYRIDHYLAKETAQNLLTFRMNNPIFAALWSTEFIERVEVRANEKISIESRVEFYEKTGALRDLVQSHLLQLLAITLMDLPSALNSEEIHRSKQYFLEQLEPADPQKTVRGQYADYREEVGNPDSTTETFVRMHLNHSSERWRNVDIILETGKGLQEKETSITIHYKTSKENSSNNLTFNIQPNEGITLGLLVKQPGINNSASRAELNFDYQKLFEDNLHIDAYERVLMDAVRADRSLFSSDAEVVATWRVIQPLLDAWKKDNQNTVGYPLGADPKTIGND